MKHFLKKCPYLLPPFILSVGVFVLFIYKYNFSEKDENSENPSGPDKESTAESEQESYGSDISGSYSCNTGGHACGSAYEHSRITRLEALGCLYCGSKDCPAVYDRDRYGHYTFLCESCPEYDGKKDASLYCPHCGLRHVNLGFPYPDRGCTRYTKDSVCIYCGETVPAFSCHCCKTGTEWKGEESADENP